MGMFTSFLNKIIYCIWCKSNAFGLLHWILIDILFHFCWNHAKLKCILLISAKLFLWLNFSKSLIEKPNNYTLYILEKLFHCLFYKGKHVLIVRKGHNQLKFHVACQNESSKKVSQHAQNETLPGKNQINFLS